MPSDLQCSKCGRFSLPESTNCGYCGNRLSPSQIPAKPILFDNLDITKKWSDRHINWSMVIGWVLAAGVGFIIGTLAVPIIRFFSSDIEVYKKWWTAIFLITAYTYALIVSIRGCLKKGRHWAFSFFIFVPFGWIILLVLENMRYRKGY